MLLCNGHPLRRGNMTDKSKEEVYAERQQSYKDEKKQIFKEAQKEAVKNKIIEPKKEEKE